MGSKPTIFHILRSCLANAIEQAVLTTYEIIKLVFKKASRIY